MVRRIAAFTARVPTVIVDRLSPASRQPVAPVTVSVDMTVRQIEGEFETVVEVLRAAASVNADVEAYVEPVVGMTPRRAMTFSQWDRAADGVAGLFADHGVTRGRSNLARTSTSARRRGPGRRGVSLEHLWAGWRTEYVSSIPGAANTGTHTELGTLGDHPLADPNRCALCRI